MCMSLNNMDLCCDHSMIIYKEGIVLYVFVQSEKLIMNLIL
jgi:hypothetical protein